MLTQRHLENYLHMMVMVANIHLSGTNSSQEIRKAMTNNNMEQMMVMLLYNIARCSKISRAEIWKLEYQEMYISLKD